MSEFVWEPLDDDDVDLYENPDAEFSAHLSVKKTLEIEEKEAVLETSGEIFKKAAEIIELIRPYVKKDGGDVRLLGIKSGWANIKFEGNCNSCGAFSGTMLEIEQSLCEEIPELKGVEVVQD